MKYDRWNSEQCMSCSKLKILQYKDFSMYIYISILEPSKNSRGTVTSCSR